MASLFVRTTEFLQRHRWLVVFSILSYAWFGAAMSEALSKTLELVGAAVFWPFIAAIWAFYGLGLMFPAFLGDGWLARVVSYPLTLASPVLAVFAYYYLLSRTTRQVMARSTSGASRWRCYFTVALLYSSGSLAALIVFRLKHWFAGG